MCGLKLKQVLRIQTHTDMGTWYNLYMDYTLIYENKIFMREYKKIFLG